MRRVHRRVSATRIVSPRNLGRIARWDLRGDSVGTNGNLLGISFNSFATRCSSWVLYGLVYAVWFGNSHAFLPTYLQCLIEMVMPVSHFGIYLFLCILIDFVIHLFMKFYFDSFSIFHRFNVAFWHCEIRYSFVDAMWVLLKLLKYLSRT